jgi:hypothetical protein
MSLGGKVTALACHATYKVNNAEELTYLSTNIDYPQVWGDLAGSFCHQGGGMGPRYVLQLLFCKNSQNCQKLGNH